MRRKGTSFWLTVLTTPFDSATPTSNKSGKFRQSESIYSHFHHFFLRMRINAFTCTSGSNSVVTAVLNDVDFLQKFRNVGDLATSTFLLIWPHFYGACAETPISQLLDTILTTLLDSATPISCNSGKFRQWKGITAVLGHFSLRMRRIGIIQYAAKKYPLKLFAIF